MAEVKKEAIMVRIKVEYDAYHRTFKLVDRELSSALEDRGLYELEVPLNVRGLPESEEFIVIQTPLAHA
jgi:hypothetical protein